MKKTLELISKILKKEINGIWNSVKFLVKGLFSKVGLISLPIALGSVYLFGPAVLYHIPFISASPSEGAYWVLGRLFMVGIMFLTFILVESTIGFWASLAIWSMAIGTRVLDILNRWNS